MARNGTARKKTQEQSVLLPRLTMKCTDGASEASYAKSVAAKSDRSSRTSSSHPAELESTKELELLLEFVDYTKQPADADLRCISPSELPKGLEVRLRSCIAAVEKLRGRH